jgi:DNA primase large subunit
MTTVEEELGIRDDKVLREIKDAVISKHYHLACTKVFEATHPAAGSLNESIGHPNQYYESSFALQDGNPPGEKASDS